MLRLLPLAIGLHLLAVALLLTVRPVPQPVPEEPPKVVFLRVLPRAAAPAPSAPATHPRPPKARPRPQPEDAPAPAGAPHRRAVRGTPARDGRGAGARRRHGCVASRSCRRSERWTSQHGGGAGGPGRDHPGAGHPLQSEATVPGQRTRDGHRRDGGGAGGGGRRRACRARLGQGALLGRRPRRRGGGGDRPVAVLELGLDRLGRPVRVVLDIPVEFSLR